MHKYMLYYYHDWLGQLKQITIHVEWTLIVFLGFILTSVFTRSLVSCEAIPKGNHIHLKGKQLSIFNSFRDSPKQ